MKIGRRNGGVDVAVGVVHFHIGFVVVVRGGVDVGVDVGVVSVRVLAGGVVDDVDATAVDADVDDVVVDGDDDDGEACFEVGGFDLCSN